MLKTVFCVKLKQTLPAMSAPPFPGPQGEYIYQNISQDAWSMWLKHQTMLINEYRLRLIDKSARDFLKEEMHKYFFTGGSETPSGFTPSEDEQVH